MATLTKTISTPTDIMSSERERDLNNGYRHLMPHLRLGRISGEVFARRRREAIPVDAEIAEEIAADKLKPAKKKELAALVARSEEPKAEEVVKKAKARKKSGKKESA